VLRRNADQMGPGIVTRAADADVRAAGSALATQYPADLYPAA